MCRTVQHTHRVQWGHALLAGLLGIAPAVTRRNDPKRAIERQALGHRLTVLRTDARLSQRDVAVALKVRPATVSAWETGTSELAALNAARLARLFKVDIAVILPSRWNDEE